MNNETFYIEQDCGQYNLCNIELGLVMMSDLPLDQAYSLCDFCNFLMG